MRPRLDEDQSIHVECVCQPEGPSATLPQQPPHRAHGDREDGERHELPSEGQDLSGLGRLKANGPPSKNPTSYECKEDWLTRKQALDGQKTRRSRTPFPRHMPFPVSAATKLPVLMA